MNIHDYQIAAHFVTCMECNKVWRTLGVTRCPRCDQRSGRTFQLDDDNTRQLAYIIRTAQCERTLLHLIDTACEWYDYRNPWHIQHCWMNIREYLRDEPSTLHLESAMNLLEVQFHANIFHVDENGELVPDQVPIIG